MSTVTAKFRVHHISDGGAAGKSIFMSPVYSSDPASENYSWSQATPGGQIAMQISNPAAAEAFELNAEYLIEFKKA